MNCHVNSNQTICLIDDFEHNDFLSTKANKIFYKLFTYSETLYFIFVCYFLFISIFKHAFKHISSVSFICTFTNIRWAVNYFISICVQFSLLTTKRSNKNTILHILFFFFVFDWKQKWDVKYCKLWTMKRNYDFIRQLVLHVKMFAEKEKKSQYLILYSHFQHINDSFLWTSCQRLFNENCSKVFTSCFEQEKKKILTSSR